MSFNVITTSSENGERLVGSQFSGDYINGLGGDDTLVGENGSDILVGDRGNDQIFAGETDTDADAMIGADGNDEMYGGGGGDLLNGGAGNDTMGGGDGNDVIFGETGVGTLDLYGLFTSTYGAGNPNGPAINPFDGVISLINFISQGTGVNGVDDNFLNSFKTSESGNDVGWGGAGRDALFGGWGNDTMGGGIGNDLVVGNRDDDVLYGARGNDVVLGGDENDSLFGGAGNDVLDGDLTPRTDNLPEKLSFPEPADLIDVEGDENQGIAFDRGSTNYNYGNSFLDDETDWVSNLRVQGGDDTIFGGEGNDLLLGRQGGDELWGGVDNDMIIAGEDNDTDVIGFTDLSDDGNDMGADTVCEFNVGETPEGRNDEWELGEDLIYLEGGTANGGEFSDATGEGAIYVDEAANLVFIDLDWFGIAGGNDVDMTGATDPTIGDGRYDVRIEFLDADGAQKFGAGNIAFDTPQGNWVDYTASLQFTDVN